MNTKRTIALGVLAAGIALAWGVAAAATTLSTEYRYAAQVSEYFIRGDAAVTESTVLKRGLRLAAWDAEEEDDATRVAVATAVYFFQVPAAAQALTIEVAYQVDQEAKNQTVAGFLFVRNQAIERQYADVDKEGKRPAEEPGFFGNTYFLPAREPRVAVTLPASDTVTDGILEVHLSAGAGQVFDAQFLQVTAFGTEIPVQVQYVAPAQYVADPYQYTYYYYYGGPCYYPYRGYYASFQVFDSFDPIFLGSWYARRACYYVHHPWVCRPAWFHHQNRPITVHRPSFIVRPAIGAYRDQWYQRCFDVDARQHRSQEDLDRLVRRRVERVSADQMREFRTRAQTVADNVRETERDLRGRLGTQFGQRAETWRQNPGQAVRELQPLEHTQAVRRASDEMMTIRTGKRTLKPADNSGKPPKATFSPPGVAAPSITGPVEPVEPATRHIRMPDVKQERSGNRDKPRKTDILTIQPVGPPPPPPDPPKIEKPDRTPRPERLPKPPAPDKIEKPDKTDKSDRSDRSDRSDAPRIRAPKSVSQPVFIPREPTPPPALPKIVERITAPAKSFDPPAPTIRRTAPPAPAPQPEERATRRVERQPQPDPAPTPKNQINTSSAQTGTFVPPSSDDRDEGRKGRGRNR